MSAVVVLVGMAMVVGGLALAARGLTGGATGHRRPRPWSDRTTRWLAWAAVAWTVLAGAVALLAPLTTTVSGSECSGPSSAGDAGSAASASVAGPVTLSSEPGATPAGGLDQPTPPSSPATSGPGPSGPQSPESRSTEVRSTTTRGTLLEDEGASVVMVVLVPVAVALAGALGDGRTARWRRITAGWVLVAACLVASASIGLFYVPAAVALLTAGIKTGVGRGGAAALGR